jgi:hypothetical protein
MTMNGQQVRMCKETVMTCFKVLSGHLLGKNDRKTKQKTLVMKSGNLDII